MKTIYQSFLILLLISTSLLSCTKETSFDQRSIPTDQISYKSMIKSLNTKVELVLSESKPANLSMKEYKTKLIEGSLKISINQQNRILVASKPLIDYGTDLAIKNNIKLDNIESAIALGGLYGPNDNIETKYTKSPLQLDKGLNVYKSNSLGSKMSQIELTDQEAWSCVFEAIGFDLLNATSGLYSTWSATAIIKTFSTIAKRFLGPVGVSIAVISLSYCLYQESND